MDIKNIDLKSFFQSKIFRLIIWGIGAVIILLVVFKAGEFVGFNKASFSYRWGEGYYRGFMGPERGFPDDFGGRNFMMGHGTFGSIISVSSSTIMIQERDGAEKIVVISKDTAIRRSRDSISINDLKVNDSIVVIGSPNNSGQIEAKLIRVSPPAPPFNSAPQKP